ncbi:MAG: holo-ACP synthase [Candidatus Eisenbacteria bacterium]
MGIGIDVIEVARIGAVLDRHGERFLRRIYTPGEQAAVHGVPAQYWAARFAVKEAAFKALGTGWARGVRWVDVEVSNLATGQPVLSFHGDAERRAQELGTTHLHVSISHTESYAVGQVVLEQRP